MWCVRTVWTFTHSRVRMQRPGDNFGSLPLRQPPSAANTTGTYSIILRGGIPQCGVLGIELELVSLAQSHHCILRLMKLDSVAGDNLGGLNPRLHLPVWD